MRLLSACFRLVLLVAITFVFVLLPTRIVLAQAPVHPAGPEPTQSVASAPALLMNIKALTSSFGQTCALTADGVVYCWGQNEMGALGNGTTTNSATPVGVLRIGSGARGIAVGSDYGCAITSAGGVRCWGRNYYGQLGDGSQESRTVPVDVVGLSGAVAITAGSSHSCALLQDGRVSCWGSNLYGQLGDGSYEYPRTPTMVSGLANVIAIAAGANSTCALTTAGAVRCWGYNGYGQLGDGTQMDRRTPVAVQGLASGVVAIDAGDAHACAVTGAGALLCWGYNGMGQLGLPVDGIMSLRTTPTPVGALASGVIGVGGGGSHTCAVKSSGELLCWGYNFYGQLGDGIAISRYTPGPVVGLGSAAAAVYPGYWHTCALLTNGQVQCWGANFAGQLGSGSIPNPHIAAPVYGMGSGVIDAAAGGAHSCDLNASGGVACWGLNDSGQLGYLSSLANPIPMPVPTLTSGVQALVTGTSHSCALTAAGGVKCWGSNIVSQLGTAISLSETTPIDVPGLTNGVAALSTNSNYTCARLHSGLVECWGQDINSMAGPGSGPQVIAGLTDVTALGTGGLHACAVTLAGSVKCWGLNNAGQLGDGTHSNQSTPVDVIGLKGRATTVVAGFEHTCALLVTGGVQCWGSNTNGQLGDGTLLIRVGPVDVVGLATGVAALAANGAYACARMSTGGMKCWGANYGGSLGDGTITNHTTPVDVVGLTSGVASMTAGSEHACALLQTGALYCWGNDGYGRLGVQPAWLPLDVVAPAPTFFSYLPFGGQ